MPPPIYLLPSKDKKLLRRRGSSRFSMIQGNGKLKNKKLESVTLFQQTLAIPGSPKTFGKKNSFNSKTMRKNSVLKQF